MDFDLIKYLAENKLNETPGYVDTFDSMAYDFYLATPKQMEDAASEIIYTLIDKGMVSKTRHKAASIVVKNELEKMMENLIKPNFYEGDLYKAAIKHLRKDKSLGQ